MAIVTDIRLQDSFFDNRKILKLERRLGAKAVLNLQRLWMHTAKNNPKGVLIGFDDDDIELAARWDGERGAFIREILCLQLLEAIEGGFAIHDWEDAQPWAFNSDTRAQRATKGGIAKANKLLEAESKQHASNAGSSAPSLSSPILPNPIQSLADEVGLFACSGEDDEKPGGPPPILTGRMARDFDWLWGRIPQEMREMGKKAEAQKAFKKLKIDNDLVQVIDIKIFMQEEDKKAKEARKEFAPRWCALSVYLNQRRWE